MTEILKQVINREVAKLPKENQEAINAFDWANIAEEIGKKYLLLVNEVNDLQVETLLVLIGLESDSFALNIENYVGTSKDEAEKIADEIGQKIFTPISDALVDKIKNGGKSQNAKPEQNLDFILSGGDYSAFMETRKIEIEPEPGETTIPVFSIKDENLKNRFTI